MVKYTIGYYNYGGDGVQIVKIEAGDVLHMKKKHPCGAQDFTVLRVGSDLRIRCNGCGHDVTVPREKLEKNIKKVISMKGSQNG